MEDLAAEAEMRDLLLELQQLTKQQTSYTTVLQSLNKRQSAVNERLLQIGAVDSRQALRKLKDMSLLELENQSLRQKVDELTKTEQLFDARMTELKSKLSESTSASKRLLQSKQRALENVSELKAQLDSSKAQLEHQQTEVDRLKADVEQSTTEKRRLQQTVSELTAGVKKIHFLEKEAAELKEKISSMERLQTLRNLRELENTSANEETENMRLELVRETTEVEGAVQSGRC